MHYITYRYITHILYVNICKGDNIILHIYVRGTNIYGGGYTCRSVHVEARETFVLSFQHVSSEIELRSQDSEASAFTDWASSPAGSG